MYRLNFLALLVLLLTITACAQKRFERTFYENGTIKSEGWLDNGTKVDFWKFYYPQGILKSSGAFTANGTKDKFWSYYYITPN
jgi:antitoxin component YwqK of YwqJK toxin-antitoxin module